jgi:hypothetical protein
VLAPFVEAAIPGCRIQYAEGGGPDPRSYRVDCSKIARILPAFRPAWTVRSGVIQLRDAFRRAGLTYEQFLGDRYLRIKHIQRLQAEELLDQSLRWRRSTGNGSGRGLR